MAATTIVWLATLVALIVVLGIALAHLVRAARAMNRIRDRVAAYSESPLMRAVEKSQDDIARLSAVGESVEPLLARAAIALEIIRRGPVPPEFKRAFARVRAEIAAFRAFAR